MSKRIALVLALCLLALTSSAQDEPLFFIESIRVQGGTAAAGRIVVAESRLSVNRTYDEPELHGAMSRIQRLPFILATDFRLAKGTAPGKYVLEILIRPMSRIFLNASSTTTWADDVTRPANPFESGEHFISQRRDETLTAGARTFAGAKGMLTLAAERVKYRNDRYTATFTQYDLFGTRASLTLVASYLDDPGASRSADPGARNDWHVRDNITWEVIGALPVGRNDSLRASWQRSERPVRYVEVTPHGFRPILRSLPEIRKELFWIHDTTNDPLFPTSGTRITAGVVRTSMPTAGFTNLGRVKNDEYRASLDHSFALTPRQALTAGIASLDYDGHLEQHRLYARYDFDLFSREQTLRLGDLRFEVEGDRIFTNIHVASYAESFLRAGLAYRASWGILRLNLRYEGWRQPRE